MSLKKRPQTPRRLTHARLRKSSRAQKSPSPRKFNYELDYKKLDLRKTPDLYRVGAGEQGVLLVEPYKSEILPYWKFKTVADAKKSASAIAKLFRKYRDEDDFVGMDMARKFLQMGFTRARRYANHKSGKKYDENLAVLPSEPDAEKAAAAEVFKKAWKKAEDDAKYSAAKIAWKARFG